MTITFEKEPNDIWYAEYSIKDNGHRVGHIGKYSKNTDWYVFVNYVFTPTKNNDTFKSLKEAKKAVVEKLSMWG